MGSVIGVETITMSPENRGKIRKEIQALKPGERLRIEKNGYVLTVGVPSNEAAEDK